MAYNTSELRVLRDAWENPDDHETPLIERADDLGLSNRQAYNRLRRLAPDRNTTDLSSLTGQERTLIDTINTPRFPEGEEQALAHTLQSINLEPKQALLLTATEQRTTTKHHGVLDDVVNDMHIRNRSTFTNYLDILHTTGMLTEYTLGGELGVNRTEYQRSQAGTRIGGPAAAGALDYAVTHGRSLYDIIGQVAKAGETTGVYTRARILETIHGSPDGTSVVDIVDNVDADRSTIDKHILQLRYNDVVNHPSAETRAKRYSLADNTVSSDLQRVFEAHEYVTAEVLADHDDITRAAAQQRLQRLNEQGTLTSPSGQQRSKLTLTWTGRSITRYINELRGLINDDDRAKPLKDAYDALQSDRERRHNHIRRGLELHTEASNNVDAQDREERLKQIYQVVKTYEDGDPCTTDISDATNLSRQMTIAYLNDLTPGRLEKVEDGNGARQRYRALDGENTI